MLFIGAVTINAQSSTKSNSSNKIELCSDYDKTTGEPIGIAVNWDVKDDGVGSNVYLIYKQDKKIKEGLTLYLDKKNANGSYIANGTYSFDNNIKENQKKWAMYDLNFREEGDYRLTVVGNSADALAVTYSNIKFMEDDISKPAKKDDVVETSYYENSKITFGESISNGTLVGESAVFRLSGSSKEIIANISQADDLKLTLIYVDIYTGTDYKEKISSLSYKVDDPTWNWISTPIKFYKKGKYVVDFYTQDEIFINSGYFEVK